jgi:dienelactone hydrolase
LLGFSLGAAIGLKLMEHIPNVELGIFFYGFPHLDQVEPDKIQGKTIVYVGGRDKIKYLSDRTTIDRAV